MECPFCGCRSFLVRDPEDAFETYEFDLTDGEIIFPAETDPSDRPTFRDDTEIHCGRCAWHGKFGDLKTQ